MMPAIVPPGDEFAIAPYFRDCKQDHQYTRQCTARRGRYRLVADRPGRHHQGQAEENLRPLLQIGRKEKSLYSSYSNAQAKRDGHPGWRLSKAQYERRQDQPHAHQQAGGILPVSNAHDAHLPSFIFVLKIGRVLPKLLMQSKVPPPSRAGKIAGVRFWRPASWKALAKCASSRHVHDPHSLKSF